MFLHDNEKYFSHLQLYSTSSYLLFHHYFSSIITNSAPTPPLSQLMPTSPPATPPAAAAATALGMNTVPLVPVSPNGAPTPSIPKAPTIDIVQILRKAKRFSILIRLLKTTQLINQLNSQIMSTSSSSGLTILAPEDSAFSKLKAGFLNSLNDRQKVELLQFHTISSFISISNFDTLTNPVQTQAGDDPTRLQLNVTIYGGSHVSMTTGAVNATVRGTVYTDNKLAIYEVDKVLLPLDLVIPKAKALAPAPTKGDSTKSDETKSPSADRSGEDDNDKVDNANVVDASAGSMSFINVELILQVPIVLGVAFFSGAII